MVLLDRELVSSYRLSIVTMSLSVWPQFAKHSVQCPFTAMFVETVSYWGTYLLIKT